MSRTLRGMGRVGRGEHGAALGDALFGQADVHVVGRQQTEATVPAVDESIPLYVVAQFMNVRATAPPYSFNVHWFQQVYAALARMQA